MSQYEREEIVEEVDEYDDEYDEDLVDIDPVEVDRLMARLEGEQNFPMAVVGSLLGAVVGAGIWGGVVYAFQIKSGLIAILIGILVGFAVRIFGKGLETSYGILGAVMSLVACSAGLILGSYALYMKSRGLGFAEVLPYVNLKTIIAILKRSFSGIDLLFYAIAAYEGYKFSFRNIEPELEELVMRSQNRR
jgi:hypothetical protein